MEALDVVKDWAQNSEDVQKIVTTTKGQFKALSIKANERSGEAKESALKALEELALSAQEAAKDLRTQAKNKGKDLVKKIKES